jgi:signal transduction histidine kinase
VRNGGARLDPGRLDDLLDPFRRLDRTTPGFGLGLSIVRSIAEAHNGSAVLTAPAEGGLEVRVRLPRRALPAAQLGPPRSPVSADPGALTKS